MTKSEDKTPEIDIHSLLEGDLYKTVCAHCCDNCPLMYECTRYQPSISGLLGD